VPLAVVDATRRDWLIDRVRPLDGLLPDVSAVTLTTSGVRRVEHGRDVGPADIAGPPPAPASGAVVRLLAPDGRLLAVAEAGRAPGFLHPAVVLG
jgi:hypothetical protein